MMAASSSCFTAVAMTGILHPFERERDSLADADAHGRESELPAAALKLLGSGAREARAGHAERVAERNRATVRVHALIVVRDAELTEDGEALRGEGLVQFDDIEVADLQAEPFHQFFARRRRANAHDPRRDTCDSGTENTRFGRQTVPLC